MLELPKDHTWWIFIFILIIVFYLIFYEIFFECMSLLVQRSRREELCEIEGLPQFYYSLSDQNLDQWIQEEVLIR